MAGTTLRITMLGPRGVGKTSLLASMYNEFDVAVKNIGGLTLIPSTETSRILSERLAELKRQTEVLSSGYDSSGTGVSGTAVSREFLFELGLIAKPMELKLIFTDFPGGFVAIQPQTVLNFIHEADVMVLAIDAPALMEQKGRWHETINAPRQMTDLLKRALQGRNETKLLLLAPIKCETYLQSPQQAAELLATVKDRYHSLLSFLNVDPLSSRVAVAITPVQTLGTVRFDRIEKTEDGLKFFFRKISGQSNYAPMYVEEVLRYTLGFSIKKYLDDLSWFMRLFKLTRPFEDAIRKMAAERKEINDGFQILQGKDLLNLKH